jgi:hypothetical protein
LGNTVVAVIARDDLDDAAWDLATVSGALSEIATTWRRALPSRPDLPLDLPQRLADMARRLAADATSLAAAGQQPAPGLALSVATRISVLSEGADYARAITSDGRGVMVGDASLWEVLRPALRRTGRRLALPAPAVAATATA